ncbi:MAG: hypothetical protein C5B57_13110 [Blastocatellia bacterium]|nr:MAG: hypothetical protein C5B57_13110 [Blastocatellia bacterium]
MRSLIVGLSICFGGTTSTLADTIDKQEPSAHLLATELIRDRMHICWFACGEAAVAPEPFRSLTLPPVVLQQYAGQPLHAAAVEHSHGYQTRAKIHKYSSFATLPLFATEIALGQSLYNTPANAGSKRTAHAIVGSGIVGLFGVNTVTGAWNLFGEGWSEKQGRTLRLVHGLLMMAADVGFVATAASGPNSNSRRGALTFETDKVTHRNIAIASISVGTAGYLLMLLGNH